MPIRINLLAEAQALEDLRRRDPIKRAIWGGVLIVAAILVWSSSLWVKSMIANSEISSLEAGISSHTSEYEKIVQSQKQKQKADQNLKALQQLTTERFLNGSLLNALQQTLVDNIQLVRIKVDQNTIATPEVLATTNSSRVTPGKPAHSTEKKILFLVGKDFSQVPGDSITRYKERILNFPYFQNFLGKTNEIRLKDLSAPQSDQSGKPFVVFTLECRYPDKTR